MQLSKLFGVAVVGLALMAAQASAGVIISESFEYELADGTSVAGLGQPDSGDESGTGWTANWDANAAEYYAGSLTHTALTSTGGKAKAVSTWDNGRDFDIAGLTDDGDVQYARFMFDYDGGAVGQNRMLFFSGDSSNQGMGVEFLTSDEEGMGTIVATIAKSNGLTPLTFSLTEDNLVVLRFTWSDAAGGDKVEMWLNPSMTTALGTADSMQTGDAVANGSVYARAGKDWYLDEIVLGETESDIGVVPEPATMSLLGLGGLVALRRRRK